MAAPLTRLSRPTLLQTFAHPRSYWARTAQITVHQKQQKRMKRYQGIFEKRFGGKGPKGTPPDDFMSSCPAPRTLQARVRQTPTSNPNIRRVKLPNTWLGRSAKIEAKRFWLEGVTMLDPNAKVYSLKLRLAMQNETTEIRLEIDEKGKMNIVHADGITFRAESELGERLEIIAGYGGKEGECGGGGRWWVYIFLLEVFLWGFATWRKGLREEEEEQQKFQRMATVNEKIMVPRR